MKTTNNLERTFSKMLSLFIAVIVIVSAAPLKSQDRIILKNGIELRGFVKEIMYETVRYKAEENPEGPVHTLTKSEIFMIKYSNGTKEVFDEPLLKNDRPAYYSVTPAPIDPRFDPDSSDFANIRRKNFSGPRVGMTYITAGTSSDYLASRGKQPYIAQFGWQFEVRMFTVDNISGVMEFVPFIGGFEQGMFIPSANLLVGLRSGGMDGSFEFALGPNFSVASNYRGEQVGFVGLVIAAGTSYKRGNVYFPINMAFVPSVGNRETIYDPASQSNSTVTYQTGAKLSLIVGFNYRRR